MAVVFNGENVGIAFPIERQDRLQYKCDNIKVLAYEFYRASAENIEYMLDGLDTSKVEDFSYCFHQSSITKHPNIDMNNATNLAYLYSGCLDLNDISGLKFTNKVTTTQRMLANCSKLNDLNPLNDCDFSNVVNASSMCNNSNLTTTKGVKLNLSSLTNGSYMFFNTFKNHEDLDEVIVELDNLNSGVNLEYGLYGCTGVNKIILKGNNISSLNSFLSCSIQDSYVTKLTEIEIDESATANCRSFSSPFNFQRKLITIGTIDFRSASYIGTLLYNNENVQNLTIKNINASIQIDNSSKLTLDSLINTIKELWDNSSGSSVKTLTIGSINKNKLTSVYVKLIDITDEMRAEDALIDNKKPCVVCESTDEGAMTIEEYVVSKNWALA